MLKFKRKLLTGILAASIALSAGSGLVWSEGEEAISEDTAVSEETSEQTDDTQAADGEAVEGDVTEGENADGEATEGENADGEATEGDAADGDAADEEASGEEEPAGITEEEALANMKLYAENDNLALYVNEETYVFAVQNKKNNYYWWSAPYDYEYDPIAQMAQKNLLLSHLNFDAGDAAHSVSSYPDSIQNATSSVKEIKNGVEFSYAFIKTDMDITVNVTLNEDSFEVEVPVKDIVEYAADAETAEIVYQLLTIDLMRGLGSAGTNDSGYILVPDGSGAIINFNNGKSTSTGTTVYQGKVYGDDLAISRDTAAAKTEQVYFPMYGMVKESESGDNALVAVVTSGDAYATLNATVSGLSSNSYNSAWFTFQTRATDTYTIGTKEPLKVYEASGIKIDDICVRYYVMGDDEINVADIADTYRNYLIEEKGLTKKTEESADALYLTLNGGTVKTQSVLGFPADLQTSATTYKEALEIIKALEEKGVSDLTVVYNDYSDGGIGGQITSGVDYSGLLGGKNDFAELYSYLNDKGNSLYPSVDFMEYYESGKGYSFTLNASKRITKAYATQLQFMYNYGVPQEDTDAWTILSPYYFPDLFRKLVESYQQEGITTISLNQATSVLYSDFSRENFDGTPYFVRHDAMEILIDGYETITNAGISILAQECNAYALPYVSAITNVPLYSSNYDLFDADVPFYQMVIHGYIPYSTKPANASSNAEELMLLSALTDSAANYQMMYSDPNIFTDCTYAELFYTHYTGWLDDAAAQYKLFSEFAPELSDKLIEKYEVLGTKQYRITYEGGTTVEVDINNSSLKVNGKAVNLADYGLKGESN